MPEPKRVTSAEQAFKAGALLGLLWKHGIDAEPLYVQNYPQDDYSCTIRIKSDTMSDIYVDVRGGDEDEEDAR